MRWWEISKGVLVEATPKWGWHWGICKIIDRATNGAVLVEEINHQPSTHIPSPTAKVRHFINAGKLRVIIKEN